MICLMSLGLAMRETPPSARMMAGTRSSAMTATAPDFSATSAWATLITEGWEIRRRGREHYRAAEIRNLKGEVLATSTAKFIEIDPHRMFAKYLKKKRSDAT